MNMNNFKRILLASNIQKFTKNNWNNKDKMSSTRKLNLYLENYILFFKRINKNYKIVYSIGSLDNKNI